MGTSTATTPGSDRQEFDFEATDGLTGRGVVTDYSVVRGDGTTVGRMTYDNVTSFSRTSGACVRFGGTGTLDTGEVFQFFIDACDNGPGAGFDTFTIELPDRPFMRSGTLTEGDIAVSTF